MKKKEIMKNASSFVGLFLKTVHARRYTPYEKHEAQHASDESMRNSTERLVVAVLRDKNQY